MQDERDPSQAYFHPFVAPHIDALKEFECDRRCICAPRQVMYLVSNLHMKQRQVPAVIHAMHSWLLPYYDVDICVKGSKLSRFGDMFVGSSFDGTCAVDGHVYPARELPDIWLLSSYTNIDLHVPPDSQTWITVRFLGRDILDQLWTIMALRNGFYDIGSHMWYRNGKITIEPKSPFTAGTLIRILDREYDIENKKYPYTCDEVA